MTLRYIFIQLFYTDSMKLVYTFGLSRLRCKNWSKVQTLIVEIKGILIMCVIKKNTGNQENT